MASIIERLQERTANGSQEVRVLSMDDGAADDVLDALSPALRRDAYRALFEQPQTMSELADELDTSVQNIQYHITSLEEAGLVETVDTVYSSKGNESAVYGPTSDPLVFVGDDRNRPQIEQSVTRVVPGLALLGIASLLVQLGAYSITSGGESPSESIAPASPGADTTTETLHWLLFGLFEPGFVFFVSVLVVAAIVLLVRN